MSTYMLTNRALVDKWIDEKELHEWMPENKKFGVQRVVLLRTQPFLWLSEPKGEDNDALEILRRETIAAIDAFVWRDADIGLHLKEIGGRAAVCEWKQQTPSPGLRILGTLLNHDILIGMMAFSRDQLPHSYRPNQADPKLWPFLMRICQQEHVRLFPDNPALRLAAAIELDDSEND